MRPKAKRSRRTPFVAVEGGYERGPSTRSQTRSLRMTIGEGTYVTPTPLNGDNGSKLSAQGKKEEFNRAEYILERKC